MPTYDQLKSQLNLDPFAQLMLRGEIKALPSIIREDEYIHAALHGYWNQDHALLLATSDRVILVDQNSTNNVVVVEFPYSDKLTIKKPSNDSLVVGTPEQKVTIRNALEEYVESFYQTVNQKLTGDTIRPSQTYEEMKTTPESPSSSPFDIVKKGFEGLSQLMTPMKMATNETKELAAPAPKPEPPEDLDVLMSRLDQLVALDTVKEEVRRLVNVIQVEKIRKERGIEVPERSLHMVFHGRPGTGKTTVARLLSKIFRALGLLSKGTLYETDRSGLVAGYTGQTALKTREVCEKSLGGILFVDEAYALNTDDTYGPEAINTIVKFMEDHRKDFVVILAGYEAPMMELIQSNPGLESRFNKYIGFQDYTPEELVDIYLLQTAKVGLVVEEAAIDALMKLFKTAYAERDDSFGNGRLARNIFEKSYENQATRLMDEGLDKADISIITVADIPEVLDEFV